MKNFIIAALMAIPFAGTATAQMCGAPTQTAQSAQSGMSCMTPSQADDPMDDKSTQQTAGMKCPCCKNMASMMGNMNMKQGASPQEHKHDHAPKQ